MPPFERFSDDARQLAAYTYGIAKKYGHASVDADHIALALFDRPNEAIERFIRLFSIDAGAVRQRLADRLKAFPSERSSIDQQLSLTSQAKRVIDTAGAEAGRSGQDQISNEHLLLSILSHPGLAAARVLVESNITYSRVQQALAHDRAAAPASDPWRESYRQPAAQPENVALAPDNSARAASAPTIFEQLRRISPVFLGLLALTVAAAAVSYVGGPLARFGLFVFVTGGWLVSLSLHEFGHALVAYLGGDRSVADKGYLTLNPFKYTHKLLSIVFPILLIVMGGIGLPGGAVYVNTGAIRSRWMRSLMSAAGPLATALCAAALLPPFVLRLAGAGGHTVFWSGMALLAFLQLSALFFNLLPIPGLDGFGILEPFLPARALQISYSIRRFTFFIIFILFFYATPVSEIFWQTLGIIIWVAGVEPGWISTGLALYRFWVP